MSEAARQFRAVFDPEKQSIERALAELETVPKDAIQETMDSLFLRIHALEKSITDNIASLPPYDGRVCIEATNRYLITTTTTPRILTFG
ncbi:hypothetical protein BGX34_007407 [Mortierella sp. NVP85]|nr:hypothetical protein BGX34_007407 [Mortierella sp. NVP85]